MEASPELIKKITDAVLEVLNRRSGNISTPTAVHAPAGLCTGDYSKFQKVTPPPAIPDVSANLPPGGGEIAAAQRRVLNGAADITAPHGGAPTTTAQHQAADIPGTPVTIPSTSPTAAAQEAPTAVAGPVLTGVITASKLAGLDGIIYLAPGAKLSPLAMDLAKQRGLQIETIAATPKPFAGIPWIYWMQGHCAGAARTIEQLRGKAIADVRTSAGQQLPEVIRFIARELAGGQTRLAVLFVPAAARAVCLANRCLNLRAIVGTCRQAVQEGIELLGANVLVLEYPHHDFNSMMELVRLFLSSSGRAPKDVEKQLTALAACQ
ncbi:MAG: hypothetical protein ACP5VQ_03330 [Phycisphaerae bacterium]